MPPDQRAHRVRRLCTFSEPVAHSLLVDLHDGRLRARVVVAEDFDKRTVTGGTGIGDDDAEERPFLGTGSTQTNGDHVTLLNGVRGSIPNAWFAARLPEEVVKKSRSVLSRRPECRPKGLRYERPPTDSSQPPDGLLARAPLSAVAQHLCCLAARLLAAA